jgi:hypothetical protein
VVDLADQLVADVAKALHTSTRRCFDLELSEDLQNCRAVNAAQFLIETSAPTRPLRGDAEQCGRDHAAASGLIATCPIAELEFFCSTRSASDARGHRGHAPALRPGVGRWKDRSRSPVVVVGRVTHTWTCLGRTTYRGPGSVNWWSAVQDPVL